MRWRLLPGVPHQRHLCNDIAIRLAPLTGAGLADDMQKGIIDRFRSLPMSRSAVVFGRTASDVIYNVLSLIIMALAPA